MELVIEKQANPALGMAHVNGKPCFVPLALAGERVRVEISNPTTKSLQARLLEVLQPSPLRVAAPCPHYGDCGGCNLMHLAPTEQQRQKLNELQAGLDALQIQVQAGFVDSPQATHFRYKANLKFGGGRLGLNRHHSEEVIEIPQCQVLSKGILAAIKNIKPARPCDIPMLESMAQGTLAARMLVEGQEQPIPGLPHALFEDYGFGLLELQAKGFAQSNPGVTKLIAQELHAWVGGKVMELHAGSGSFSLALAQKASKLSLVEEDKSAAGRLKRNLEKHGFVAEIQQTTTLKAKLEPGLDWLVLDPPKAGLERGMAQKVLAARPGQIAYVSCNPQSFLRDLAPLLAGGYRLQTVTAFDMYPQTSHWEVLGRLVQG